MTKSKRFWASCGFMAGNFWLFYSAIHSAKDIDFISLGTGLAVLALPLIAYIAGESWRPSGTMDAGQVESPQAK